MPELITKYALKSDGIEGKVNYATLAYRIAQQRFDNSRISLGIMARVKANFRIKDLYTHKAKLPIATSTSFPISVHTTNSYKFEKTSSGVAVHIPLINYKLGPRNFPVITSGTKYIPVRLRLNPKDTKVFKEVDKILSGEYLINDVHLVKKSNKWRLNITLTYCEFVESPDKKNVAGIDMGISTPFVLGIPNGFKKLFAADNDLIEHNKRMDGRRRAVTKRNHTKRVGHGIKNKLKPLTKLTEYSNNFSISWIRRQAKEIQNICVQNKVTDVTMEDLSGIDKSVLWLGKYWNYATTQTAIENKLKEVGIAVEYVSPAYSSRTCSACGHLHKDFSFDYRKANGMPKFKCPKCGFDCNADLNASYVLAKKTHLQYAKLAIDDES